MWTLTIVPLVIALSAGLFAWHHATQLDRHEGAWPAASRDPPSTWPLALGALIAAVLAATVLQLAMLSSLGLRG